MSKIPEQVVGRLADFHLGTPVFSADGKHVGSLERVLVNNQDWDFVALVLKEMSTLEEWLEPGSAMVEANVIVPFRAVRSATRDRIELKDAAADVRGYKPYLDYGHPLDANQADSEYEQAMLVSAEFASGLFVPPLTETAHKPADEIEVRAGENVMLGHAGKKFGEVRDVVLDGDSLAGIVVKPESLFSHDVLVPVRFLERSDDLALFVDLTEDQIRNLQRFKA